MTGLARTMRFIGDVHGQFERYEEIIAAGPASVQVGDFGVGFRALRGPGAGRERSNPPHRAMTRGNHRFIRGNHDNPDACRRDSQWIADGAFENGMMFLGGAFSADRALRHEGYDWWPGEELSINELKEMIALYKARKPRIMVTHDCPEEASRILLSRTGPPGPTGFRYPSRTGLAMQEMWMAHAPETWIFGHYHESFDHVLHAGRETGTRFICLAELEHRDIDVS